MTDVPFSCPIRYHGPTTWSQALLQSVESYLEPFAKEDFDGKITIAHITPENTRQAVSSLHTPSIDCRHTALKVASYILTLGILPLLALAAKAILRQIHTFEFISGNSYAQHCLKKGFSETLIPEIRTTIASLQSNILNHQDCSEIHWIKTGISSVFQLTQFPQYIFHIGAPVPIYRKFAHICSAQEICFAHSLDRIALPSTQYLDIDSLPSNLSILMQQFIDAPTLRSANAHDDDAIPAVQQMMRLAAETHLACTRPRDVRFGDALTLLRLRTSQHFPLHDSIHSGLLGSQAQVHAAVDEAVRCGLLDENDSGDTKAYKRIGNEEVARNRQIRDYHIRHGLIDNPRRPLQEVDLSTLPDIEARDGQTTITLKQTAQTIIDEINRLIADNPTYPDLQGIRSVLLDLRATPAAWHWHDDGSSTEHNPRYLWIYHILRALQGQHAIFGFRDCGNRTFMIWA